MTLNEFMLSNKLTAQRFAVLVDASPYAVGRWRRGERMPRPAQMARIYEATEGKVTANDFMAAREAAQ